MLPKHHAMNWPCITSAKSPINKALAKLPRLAGTVTLTRLQLKLKNERCFPSRAEPHKNKDGQEAGPPPGGLHARLGLFLISWLGTAKGSFREDPGLPFHHAKPTLPRDGPASRTVRTASILCVWHRQQDSRENPGVRGGCLRPRDLQRPPRAVSRPLGDTWFHKSTFAHSLSGDLLGAQEAEGWAGPGAMETLGQHLPRRPSASP